jgi:CRISPR/Cas system-associated endonuclease Cas1
MDQGETRDFLPPNMWRELNGDGFVFEPKDTSVLLAAQCQVNDWIAEQRSRKVAQAWIANKVLQLARKYQARNTRLDVQAISAAVFKELNSLNMQKQVR